MIARAAVINRSTGNSAFIIKLEEKSGQINKKLKENYSEEYIELLMDLALNDDKTISGLSTADFEIMSRLYREANEVLKERYKGTNMPIYDKEYHVWCVNTNHGFEIGDVAYIAEEFRKDIIVYPYDINGEHQHTHSFEGIIETILKDYQNFSIESYKEAYSSQELRIIDNLLKTYKDKE